MSSPDNPFRYVYAEEMPEHKKALINEIRLRAFGLYALLQQVPASRERSLAMTKLEECAMWANKGVAHDE